MALVDMHLSESRNSDGFNQSSLSLGGAGTRRAVYYAEESNGNQETPQDNFVSVNQLISNLTLCFNS